MNRLGQAGVSVPGFNIDRTSSTQNTSASTTTPAAAPSQLNELQARFSRMQTPSTQPAQQQQQPIPMTTSSGGTTWAAKQSALNTAANFHKDPSSVSWKDAKEAASTANNFRERHGEQVAQGYQTASAVNQKYGVAQKVGGFAASAAAYTTGTPGQAQGHEQGQVEQEYVQEVPSSTAAAKKAPPPPPKKKLLMVDAQQAGVAASGAPPPIPLSSKPR